MSDYRPVNEDPNAVPLISLQIMGRQAESLGLAGKAARILLHADGSVTWELRERPVRKRRSWSWFRG